MKKNSTLGVALAAATALSLGALSPVYADDAKGSVVSVPEPVAKAAASDMNTPDPAIAKGLAIHNLENVGLGKIDDIVTRGQQKIAVISVGLVTGRDGTQVVLPLDALKVQNGVIVYDKKWDDFVSMERLGSRDPAEVLAGKDKN